MEIKYVNPRCNLLKSKVTLNNKKILYLEILGFNSNYTLICKKAT